MKKIIVCIFLIILLVGCKAKEIESPLIGVWLYVDNYSYYYTFNSNGIGESNGNIFTFTDEDNELTIAYTGSQKPVKLKYEITNNELIIESNSEKIKYINIKDAEDKDKSNNE